MERGGIVVRKEQNIARNKRTRGLLSDWKRRVGAFGMICCLGMAATVFAGNSISVNAATVTVKQGEDTVEWTGKKVVTQIDGKKITIDNASGIQVQETYMVPYEEVFEDYLEVNCTYSESARTLTLTANNATVKLTVDSNIAYVNEEKYELKTAPFFGIIDEKEKLYVPAEFVAKKLNYGFAVKSEGEYTDTINIMRPFQVKKGEETQYIYGEKIEKLIYNNRVISLKNGIPGIKWNKEVYIPCSALKKAPIYAKVSKKDAADRKSVV